jgi:hypothetical protein
MRDDAALVLTIFYGNSTGPIPSNELTIGTSNYIDGEGVERDIRGFTEGGYRFVLYDGTGKPCAELDYASYAEAEAGWKKLVEALKSVPTVKGLR